MLVGALTKKSRVQVVQTHNFQVYYKIHFLTVSSLQDAAAAVHGAQGGSLYLKQRRKHIEAKDNCGLSN